MDAAISASVNAPPDVQQLLEIKRTIETASDVVRAADQEVQLRRGESLFALIGALEQAIREEIRLHSQAVIDEISEDIRRMWSTLHPEEAIDDVHLYLPKDADKAIDIGLKFHGEELESPRITLSEGYRNSLGLCIFLAMAKRGASSDGPILLDDVVVSLDHGHRGMIVELLEKEFSSRQVIILTHDRDWYTDLRQQLDKGTWTFKVLVPYENPKIGIRWAHTTTTFEDARAQLPTRPDSAGNDARKIMDAELAMIAERLQIRLPYLRFEKNDRRLAHEFLERIGASAKKCYQKKSSVDFVTHTDAIQALSAADSLLLSWANRASHSFDVVRPEAKKLIDLCEKALEVFRCVTCGKPIWFADSQASEWLQCHCGEIRWRYGKE